MSVIRSAARGLRGGIAAFGLCWSMLPACAAFGGNQSSTVAQGKYYASGEAHYDEFFIALYWMQVAMAEATRVPENERLALARALSLPPQADVSTIGERLRQTAQQLDQTGLHLRLDRNPAADQFAQASVTLRRNLPAKDDSSRALLAQVEESGTQLMRSIDDTTQGEQNLAKLEPQVAPLRSGVDAAFADARFGTIGEVQKNLDDARQLIPLMRARAAEVRRASEALLLELSRAVNTDDGSIGPAPSSAASEAHAGAAPDTGKKLPAKPHAKPKPVNSTAAPSSAVRPKPSPEGDNPAPAPKPNKAPPAPRDFEP